MSGEDGGYTRGRYRSGRGGGYTRGNGVQEYWGQVYQRGYTPIDPGHETPLEY